jgi:hypothetical protein
LALEHVTPDGHLRELARYETNRVVNFSWVAFL